MLDMTSRSDWVGLIGGRRRSLADLELVVPLNQGDRGGSGAFLGRASDGRRYWIKPLNNGQHERVPVNEQIVGRTGALIGAPTCEVKTIKIPDDIANSHWKFHNDLELQAGIAHGSLHVEGCVDTNDLHFRSMDDNRMRHCYILALFDWCWGGDNQWLHVQAEDQRYYSHDHGWYLPLGPNWNEAELERVVDEPHELNDTYFGFDLWSASEVTGRLRRITKEALIDVLEAIPSDWPVSDQELEAMGFFLERRAQQVANRMRVRLGVNP
jgi:hypothetical protein